MESIEQVAGELRAVYEGVAGEEAERWRAVAIRAIELAAGGGATDEEAIGVRGCEGHVRFEPQCAACQAAAAAAGA